MKKLIGLFLVFLLGVGSTLAYLAWRDRATARNEAVLDLAGARAKVRKLALQASRARQRDGTSQIQLTEDDLNALITSALEQHARGEDLVRVVREVRTDIRDDSLEVGVAIDVGALERSGLADAEMLDQVLGILPMLGGQELYVGFRGVPGVSDGELALVDGLEATIGFLTIPVGDLESRLGFSAERLYSNLSFGTSAFTVEEVRARAGQLTLEVRAR